MSKGAKLTLTNLCSRVQPKERLRHIEKLLADGASLGEYDDQRNTLIHYLIADGDSKTLRGLLQKKELKATEFVKNFEERVYGFTFLDIASLQKSGLAIFKVLFDVKVPLKNTMGGGNPLSRLLTYNPCHCLKNCHLFITKEMLDKGTRLPDESKEWYEENIPNVSFLPDIPAQQHIYKKIWNLYHHYRVFDHLEAGNIAAADAHFERGRVLPDSGLEREGKNLLTAVLHVQAKTDTATIARDDFALKILVHHPKPLKLARAAIDTVGAENIPSRVAQAINALEAQERQSSPRHRVATAFSTAFGCVAAFFQPTPAGYTPLHEEQPHRTDSTITLHTPEQPTVGKVH